ncbi:hypothetical protein GCM10027348_30000 [Hymenobacter tenuis]
MPGFLQCPVRAVIVLIKLGYKQGAGAVGGSADFDVGRRHGVGKEQKIGQAAAVPSPAPRLANILRFGFQRYKALAAVRLELLVGLAVCSLPGENLRTLFVFT